MSLRGWRRRWRLGSSVRGRRSLLSLGILPRLALGVESPAILNLEAFALFFGIFHCDQFTPFAAICSSLRIRSSIGG